MKKKKKRHRKNLLWKGLMTADAVVPLLEDNKLCV
jgi:hypothetical protein